MRSPKTSLRSLATLVGSALIAVGCATSNLKDPTQPPPKLSRQAYADVIKKFSRQDEQYAGFQNTFFVVATLRSAEVMAEQMDQMRFYYQWDESAFARNREKAMQTMSNSTELFLTFFSPEKDYDDLHRGSTIWKTYLEVDGKRYEGKVEKLKDKFADIVHLYPHFPRWATAYRVSFPVPSSAAERNAKFTLTSSLGQTQFTF
jgi:hypothetical protein